MGSLKVKLALYFALLALLPLAVTFYGFGALAYRSETRRVDARLQAGLRAVVANYVARLDAADATAERVGRDPAFLRALRTRDRAGLERISGPRLSITVGGRTYGGKPPGAATRRVTVTSGGNTLAVVSVAVPIDESLLRRLHAGLSERDQLIAVRAGAVVVGRYRGSPLGLPQGTAHRVRLGEDTYRALATGSLPRPAGVSLALLAPQQEIDRAARADEQRLLLPLILSFLVFAVVTYVLGRSIVRTLRRLAEAANALAGGRLGERVEVRGRDEFAQLGNAFNRMAAQLEQRLLELESERRRLRDQRARFGDALAATLDPDQLLKVIVEAAVELTGAYGGVVVDHVGELARAGDPERGPQRLELPLTAGRTSFGTLVLRGSGFSEEESESAAGLAAQAGLALDNVRLHRVVEEQALEDALTGLANRRSLEKVLVSAIAHAQRSGEEVCLVLADLDDFKLVNDRYGHPCGDMVLREFASELEATAREDDLAGRWGGEEFALVLRGADAAGGAQLAERARERFAARALRSGDDAIAVTGSFGVASFPEFADVTELIAAADDALYEAKRRGKNCVAIAVPGATR